MNKKQPDTIWEELENLREWVYTLEQDRNELLAACKAALKRLAFADPTKQPADRPASAEDQGAFVQLQDAIIAAEKGETR